MTQAMRYAMFGAVCATITALFQPAWYVTIIAFWLGTFLGLVGSLAVSLFDWAINDEQHGSN